MLPFDDPRWPELEGGYRGAYDVRPALDRLAAGDGAAAWQELWNELHHQGDVGTASYAAVPHLLRIHSARGAPDWNTLAMLTTIELARQSPHNPPIPAWLRAGYDAAWDHVVDVACHDLTRSTDRLVTTVSLGAIALARGLPTHARLLSHFGEDELEEMVALYEGG